MIEIYSLLDINRYLRDRPKFRRNLEVLNKSGIVLLVACWESFVEDLASHSFDFMLSNATKPNVFPTKVLTRSSKVFWDSKDERGVWALADVGWRTVLTSHKSRILQDYIGSFNTPRSAQVDALFEMLIGFKNSSSHWHWKNMSNNQAKKKLGDLITLRGAIAHRVSASKSVTRRSFLDYCIFISRVGMITSNTLRDFVHKRVGEYPWRAIKLEYDWKKISI